MWFFLRVASVLGEVAVLCILALSQVWCTSSLVQLRSWNFRHPRFSWQRIEQLTKFGWHKQAQVQPKLIKTKERQKRDYLDYSAVRYGRVIFLSLTNKNKLPYDTTFRYFHNDHHLRDILLLLIGLVKRPVSLVNRLPSIVLCCWDYLHPMSLAAHYNILLVRSSIRQLCQEGMRSSLGLLSVLKELLAKIIVLLLQAGKSIWTSDINNNN